MTFKKALELFQGIEMAANNAKDIQKGNEGSQMANVHHVRRETRKETVKGVKRVECFQCG